MIRKADVQGLLQMPNLLKVETVDLTLTLNDFLALQEKMFIEKNLQWTKDIDRSAELLKVSKSNLYKKIKDLGIVYE